ncbi:MAG: adenosylcobinamide-GDP ribazoletransferase [Proteobacteria bacterium]|nr:adenosylcobinamide-GDP ribazoletransferase [Pseudomonadota bacterium]MBU1740238.1 adenosylcobinamide-GDP ribazoletransferase [Pseudomonadota bacterium]
MVVWLRRFVLALQFLSVVTIVPRLELEAGDRGGSMIFYPLIGLLLGLAVAGADYGLGLVFPPLVTAVFVVALWELLTRGLHLDGLADTADGLMGASDRTRALEIMHDTRLGVFGAGAVFLVLLLKVVLVAHLSADRFIGLLLIPVFARMVMVGLAWALPSAGGRLGRPFVAELRWWHAASTLALAGAAGLVLGGLHGLLMGLVVIIVAGLWGAYLYYRLGGVTGDVLGAAGEMTEAAGLAVWLLAPGGPLWV